MSDPAGDLLEQMMARGQREIQARATRKPAGPKVPKPKKRATPERDAQRAVVAWLRKAGCIVQATFTEQAAAAPDVFKRSRYGQARKASGATTGFPDLTVVTPGGRVVFVEMKSAKGRPNAAQIEMHALLRSRGQVVVIGRDIWSVQHELDQAGVILTRTGWTAPKAEAL